MQQQQISSQCWVNHESFNLYSGNIIETVQRARRLMGVSLNLNLRSCNILISACVRRGVDDQALLLYRTMDCDGGMRPDRITLVSVLHACANLRDLKTGKCVHERIISIGFDSCVVVASAAVSMYHKCFRIDLARETFQRATRRSVTLWNTIITAYAQRGHHHEALGLFEKMDFEPDCFTFSAVLGACAASGNLEEGRRIHEMIRAREVFLDVAAQNALVTMYVECGGLEEARKVFDDMASRDVISWNAIITGYIQSSRAAEALELYKRMGGVQPNATTYASVLMACSQLGDVNEGREIHKRVAAFRTYGSSLAVQNSLVNLYTKCGSFDEAKSVFERMRVRDFISWNLMIAACAKHQMIQEMDVVLQHELLEGYQPDEVTFRCILHTCSHTGLLQQGLNYFVSMLQDHFLVPLADHFRIMVDLLGRAGLLSEAEFLINRMPFQPEKVVWKSFLSACRNDERSRGYKTVVEHLLVKDISNSAPYVLASHVIT